MPTARKNQYYTPLLNCRVCGVDFFERDFPNDILFCPALANRWDRFCEINQNDLAFSPLIFDEWLRFQRRKWRNFCGSCWRALEEDHSVTLDVLTREGSAEDGLPEEKDYYYSFGNSRYSS